MSAHYGLEACRRRRVKLSTIDSLNDPFEWSWLTSDDPAIRLAIRRTKQEMAGIAGILCFSQSWRNPLLWSHYADRHRGVCLGFDVPDEYLSAVDYTRNRLQLTEQTDTAIRAKLIRTKFSHWRYESETRLFEDIREMAPENGLYFKDFSEHLTLRQVIIGPGAELRRQQVMEALGSLAAEVALKNTRLSFKRYAVVTQRDTRLWT